MYLRSRHVEPTATPACLRLFKALASRADKEDYARWQHVKSSYDAPEMLATDDAVVLLVLRTAYGIKSVLEKATCK